MECTHTWGAQACQGGDEAGLLCYAVLGEKMPRVDFSCEHFADYHGHHSGITVLVFWTIELMEGETIYEWFKRNRGLFEAQVANKVRPIPQKRQIIAGALAKYDKLAESQGHLADESFSKAI